jgi:hypothetical protein
LGFDSPVEVVESAVNFAQIHDFSEKDVQRLNDLLDLLTAQNSSSEMDSK